MDLDLHPQQCGGTFGIEETCTIFVNKEACSAFSCLTSRGGRRLRCNSVDRSGLTPSNIICLASSGSCEEVRQKIFGISWNENGYALDKPLSTALPEGSSLEERATFENWLEDNRKICSIILASMTKEIQKQYDRLNDVPSIILHMKESLPPSYDLFIINYNMNGLEKSTHELINMLVQYKATTYKSALVVLVGGASTTKTKGKRAGYWKRKKGKGKVVAATTNAEGTPTTPLAVVLTFSIIASVGKKQNAKVGFEETYSPIAMAKSIRILLAIAAWYDYEIWEMDVKMTFLNGFVEEEILMDQPDGFTFVVEEQKSDDDNAKSESGFAFKLNGGVVAWKSSKQATTADSTIEAEYIAASEAAKEVVWIKNYIQELGVVPSVVELVVVFCDNNRVIAQTKELISHHRSKYILRCYHLLREMVRRGDVRIDQVSSAKNTTNPLTKSMSPIAHTLHLDKMGLRSMGDLL
ncbi:UNVERIFIED_CONTAM: Retrovirus-related Pol polyprotein from transposon TNT 1-94 [Sesamum calycinum]|uniref:Retrovirus-related Pol polyprotein from transposon TNT 1-94 n=1 Tax=Sesamum calycinum TaxID=2727403 RepID=A0AAW2RNX7_9LAMI